MSGTPTKNLEPLAPILGRWRSSGTVVDDEGNVTMEVSGTDTYTLLPGGHWIAHEVDVRMGAEGALAHEPPAASTPPGVGSCTPSTRRTARAS